MDLIFANALVKRDGAAARIWWNRMEAKRIITKETRFSSFYWKASCALLFVEGRLTEAGVAWERGNAVANALPSAGVYEFERFCFARLREALDSATTAPA